MQTPLDTLVVALEHLGNLFIMLKRKHQVNVSLLKDRLLGALQDAVLQQHDAPRSAEWGSLRGCTKCLCCSKRGTGALMDAPLACVALK